MRSEATIYEQRCSLCRLVAPILVCSSYHFCASPPALKLTHRSLYSLFVDVKRSTQFLMEYQKEFMFNELNDDNESSDDDDDDDEEVVGDDDDGMDD